MATTQDRPSRNLGRLSEIAQVAARHGFGYFLRRNRLGDLVPGDANGNAATASDRGKRLRAMLDELASEIGARLGVERDEVRAVIADLLDSWRREATRLGESGGTYAARAASELGAASRESVGDLALRVAQLEHRMKLLERDRDA